MSEKQSMIEDIKDVLVGYFEAGYPENAEATGDILKIVRERLRVHLLIGLYGGIINEVGVYTSREAAHERALELAKEYDCERNLGEDYWRDEEDHFFAMDAERENEVSLRYDLSLDQKHD